MNKNLVARIAPAVFVFIWSTGFIGAKYGLPYGEPFAILGYRMVIASLLLAAIASFNKAQRLTSWNQVSRSAIVGIFFHAGYLGGVFYAINEGFPVSVSALVVSLQPVLVAALSKPLLNHSLVPKQWFGIFLGFAGVTVALIPGLTATKPDQHFRTSALIAELVALASTTTATLLQKRHGGGIPPIGGTSVQYAAAAIVLLPLAFATEDMSIQWTPQFIATFLWLIGALSLGAVLILYWLLRQGTAASVSSLYYLVPPTTLLMSFILFGERLQPLALVGFAVASAGVALVRDPVPHGKHRN